MNAVQGGTRFAGYMLIGRDGDKPRRSTAQLDVVLGYFIQILFDFGQRR
jgi:hypothetical protein